MVTGGGGFIGRRVVDALLARGAEVTVLARGTYAELAALGVETISGDVADEAIVERACRGRDVVFHVAAKAGLTGPLKEYERTNVIGTRNIIAGCRSAGIRRLIFTSTPSVVLDGTDIEGGDESIPYPSHHKSPYARTKAIAEQAVLAANGPDLATVALRPHIVWGPGDPHGLPRMLERAKRGKLVRLRTGARCLVDQTYVDDAAAAHLLAADRLFPGSSIAGRVYFISGGQPVPFADIVDAFIGLAGYPPVSRRISPRLAYALAWVVENAYRVLPLSNEPPLTTWLVDQMRSAHWFDISAARRDLGYAPSVSFEEGLRRLKTSMSADPEAGALREENP